MFLNQHNCFCHKIITSAEKYSQAINNRKTLPNSHACWHCLSLSLTLFFFFSWGKTYILFSHCTESLLWYVHIQVGLLLAGGGVSSSSSYIDPVGVNYTNRGISFILVRDSNFQDGNWQWVQLKDAIFSVLIYWVYLCFSDSLETPAFLVREQKKGETEFFFFLKSF